MITPKEVAELVEKRFGEAVDVSHFEAKPWHDDKMQRSWRDYLLALVTQRLHGARDRGVAEDVISETESFRSRLEVFAPPHELFSFSANSSTMVYAGWMIDRDIVFCIPSAK